METSSTLRCLQCQRCWYKGNDNDDNDDVNSISYQHCQQCDVDDIDSTKDTGHECSRFTVCNIFLSLSLSLSLNYTYLVENFPFHFGSSGKKHLSLTTSTSLPSTSGNCRKAKINGETLLIIWLPQVYFHIGCYPSVESAYGMFF